MAEGFTNGRSEGAYDDILAHGSTSSSHFVSTQNAEVTTYHAGIVDQLPASSSNTVYDGRPGVQNSNRRQEIRDIHPPVELAHHTNNNFASGTSESSEYFHADVTDDSIISHSVAEEHQQCFEQNVGSRSSQSASQEMTPSNEVYNHHLGVNTFNSLSSAIPQHDMLEHRNSIMDQRRRRWEWQASRRLQLYDPEMQYIYSRLRHANTRMQHVNRRFQHVSRRLQQAESRLPQAERYQHTLSTYHQQTWMMMQQVSRRMQQTADHLYSSASTLDAPSETSLPFSASDQVPATSEYQNHPNETVNHNQHIGIGEVGLAPAGLASANEEPSSNHRNGAARDGNNFRWGILTSNTQRTSLTPTDNINQFITNVQDSTGHTFDFDYIRCIVEYSSCSESIIRCKPSPTEVSAYVLKVLINGEVVYKLGKNIKDLTIQAIRNGFDLFLSTRIEGERCIKQSSFTVLFCVLQLFVESVDRLTSPSSHTNVEDYSINIDIIEEILKFIQNCNPFLFRHMEIFNTDDNLKYALIEVIEITKKLFFRLAVTVHESGRDIPLIFQEPIIPFPSLRLRQEPPILNFEEVAAVWKKVDELPDNLDDLCKEGDRCNICYEEDSKELAILDSCSHKICLTCARRWFATAR